MAIGLVMSGVQAFACVGCREPGAETIAKEPQTVLAGLGFSWSVLFMLGFAIAVVSGISCYIWQTCKELDRSRAQE